MQFRCVEVLGVLVPESKGAVKQGEHLSRMSRSGVDLQRQSQHQGCRQLLSGTRKRGRGLLQEGHSTNAVLARGQCPCALDQSGREPGGEALLGRQRARTVSPLSRGRWVAAKLMDNGSKA